MSSNLENNKIAAAVLVGAILAMVSGYGAKIVYPAKDGAHHSAEGEAKRGFVIEGAEAATGDTGGAAASDAMPDILPLLAKADANAGKDAAKKCAACHSFEKGGPNKVGPNLWGVVGAGKGKHAGFAYSSALSGMSGTWGYSELAQFLYNPKKYVPGTKMSFAGVKKPEELANIIAYLRSNHDSPPALPK